MFNLSNLILILILLTVIFQLLINQLNVRNLIYGVLVNLILFVMILQFLVKITLTVALIVFFFFFISFDLLIFYVYIYSKFNLTAVKEI